MAASRLRLTGGVFRGLPIVEPRGHRLRPSSSRLREAIFNVLGADVEDATVLDLYAGSGALGLEALSRGARHATFIDEAQASISAIEKTLSAMHLRDAATLVRGALPGALRRLDEMADIVLLDPPYDDESAPHTLDEVHRVLSPRGTVVYEHASRYNPPERPPGLILRQRRVYGDSAIALYALQEGE